MAERPILFSAPMVWALRENRKTQTRRLSGLKKINEDPDAWDLDGGEFDSQGWCFRRKDDPVIAVFIRCPYGVAGDRLWVRTNFDLGSDFAGTPIMATAPNMGERFAMHPEAPAGSEDWFLKWKRRPSIHMPRWASPDVLEVVSVRPERLQSITDVDAMAEGVDKIENGFGHLGEFFRLWVSINGTKSWDANFWVWRVEFRRLTNA